MSENVSSRLVAAQKCQGCLGFRRRLAAYGMQSSLCFFAFFALLCIFAMNPITDMADRQTKNDLNKNIGLGGAVPQYLYKVISKKDWDDSQGEQSLQLTPIDKEFIHLAEDGDVQRIINKFFADEPVVVVVKLDPAKFKGRLVKERNPGGTTEYFHLYEGSIPMEAVVDARITSNLPKSKH